MNKKIKCNEQENKMQWTKSALLLPLSSNARLVFPRMKKTKSNFSINAKLYEFFQAI